MINILIMNGSTAYQPIIIDGVEWTTERKGSPGKLEFSCLKDDILDITEGNPVKMSVDDVNVFYGYIFSKSRSKNGQIKVTCYDQLRYFKNKDTYQYTNKTASQLLGMVCDDFELRTGTIEDSGYIIPKKLESNKTLFDIIQDALDDTLLNIQKLYVMYDNYGEITLQNIATMKVGYIVDSETGQDFEYKSSIDSETYNQVKLTYDNEDTGKRDIYLTKDTSNINRWGILQYHDTLQDGENGAAKAEQLLQYYNRKTRNLTVKGLFGDIRLRAGCSPFVSLNLGDIIVNNYMVCEKVKHVWKDGEHTMDISLIGSEFVA